MRICFNPGPILVFCGKKVKKHLHLRSVCAIIFVAPERVKGIWGSSTVGRTRYSYCHPRASTPAPKCGANLTQLHKKTLRGISTVGSALHSHCRGHRFESGMLHHKSCISMQDFLFSCGFLQDLRCKAFISFSLYLAIPQFVPQFWFFSPCFLQKRRKSFIANHQDFFRKNRQ